MTSALQTVVLTVPSAHCATCRLRILDALGLPGIAQADVDLRTREATVLFDPGETSAAAIVAALVAAGHPPEPDPTAPQSLPNRTGAWSAHSDGKGSSDDTGDCGRP